MTAGRTAAFAAGLAGGVALGRAVASRPAEFARMAGSSIAAPDAAGWITDFLNAAYYRREPHRRDGDDLRLASALVTPRGHRLGHRRLRLGGAGPFFSPVSRAPVVDGARAARR